MSAPSPVAGAMPGAIVVMGVSGCGKSTVGQALAQRLGWEFQDADRFHPQTNVDKMRAGTPLQDADRWPWLDRLNSLLRHSAAKRRPVVLACSALKQVYRDRLAARMHKVCFVHLQGSFELIEQRLALRSHAYMPSSLLRSQFETLETPGDALFADIAQPVEIIVADLAARLHLDAPQSNG